MNKYGSRKNQFVLENPSHVHTKLLNYYEWEYSHTTWVRRIWNSEMIMHHTYKWKFNPDWCCGFYEDSQGYLSFGKLGNSTKHDCRTITDITRYLKNKKRNKQKFAKVKK